MVEVDLREEAGVEGDANDLAPGECEAVDWDTGVMDATELSQDVENGAGVTLVELSSNGSIFCSEVATKGEEREDS